MKKLILTLLLIFTFGCESNSEELCKMSEFKTFYSIEGDIVNSSRKVFYGDCELAGQTIKEETSSGYIITIYVLLD